MADEKKLIPATDEEIAEAINEAWDEMQDEIDAIFNAPPTEEEEAMMAEFDAAKTPEERFEVMKKYKVGPYREGAEGVVPIY